MEPPQCASPPRVLGTLLHQSLAFAPWGADLDGSLPQDEPLIHLQHVVLASRRVLAFKGTGM
eukprot:1160093-Pelagomonas_calceolata.AAC.12